VSVLTDARSGAAGAEGGRHVLFVNADADLRSVVTRVLEREHVLYPLAVGWLVRGLLRIDANGVVTHLQGEPQLLL